MNFALVTRAPVQVACMRYTGPLGPPLGKFWRHTFSPWLAEHGLLDCPRYGITLDNPMTTPHDRIRYDCCVAAPPALELPGAATATIAGGRYAVANFRGTGADIGRAWGEFHSACSARHALDPQRFPVEHYPRNASFDPKTGVFACELCIPVND